MAYATFRVDDLRRRLGIQPNDAFTVPIIRGAAMARFGQVFPNKGPFGIVDVTVTIQQNGVRIETDNLNGNEIKQAM